MTQEQKEDLFIEWGLYEPHAQQAIIDEYNFCIGERVAAAATSWTPSKINLRYKGTGIVSTERVRHSLYIAKGKIT